MWLDLVISDEQRWHTNTKKNHLNILNFLKIDEESEISKTNECRIAADYFENKRPQTLCHLSAKIFLCDIIDK